MLKRLKPFLPFVTTVYLAAAGALTLYPPWYAGFHREGIDRVFKGYAWMWSREPSQAQVDWPALACGHLALLLACACLLGVFCCVQIVFASKIFISVLGWLRRVFRLPAKAAVPLCAAYLLAAAFLAVHLNQPVPDFDLSTLKPIQTSQTQQNQAAPPPYSDIPPGYKLLPPRAAAPSTAVAAPPQPSPSDESYWTIQPAQTAPRGSLTGSRVKLLAEVVLFLFTTAVYFGLAILFRWRRLAQESGAE